MIVADRENHRLQLFTFDGQYVASWYCHMACGVAVDPAGCIYVGQSGGPNGQFGAVSNIGARIVIFDYSSNRCVEANVDLDACAVQYLSLSTAQPMLAEEEEAAAMHIAVSDDRVRRELSLGEAPQVAMHYWSDRPSDLSHNRRTAAVLFGMPGARPSLVAVVDLLDAQVTDVVSAQAW